MNTYICGIVLLFNCALLNGQEAHLFPYQPPVSFQIDKNLIALHHPVTTSKPLAQAYFDQGLTLMYAFNHDAAYWSFLRASEVDPEMAMAYWGMAIALGPNINMDITPDRQKAAYNAIQKALTLTKNITENERDYIQTLSLRYSNAEKPDLKKQSLDYYNRMKRLVEKYPDDLDAAVLFTESGLDLNPWNQWDNQGNPNAGTLELVQVLESVLKRDPNHLGANHYYIHAIEASNHPEYALMSAGRLRTMLPASGHILHMPAHIYLLVGDYHQAALLNEQAAKVDYEYIKKYGIEGIYPVHYLSHNLYFLSRAYSMEGRFEDAFKASQQVSNFYAPHFKAMPDLEYYLSAPTFTLLRFHRWKEVLNMPEPDNEMKVTKVLWHFARAISFAALGERERALEEQKKFIEGKNQIPSDIAYGYNKATPITEIAAAVLEAKLFEVDNLVQANIDALKKAVAIQDTLHYNEPPDWFFPVRESLGAALIKIGQYKEAEKVFREDLDKHPRNGRALFGLFEALKAQDERTDRYWVETAFKEAWKNSTTPLSLNDL